MKGKSVILNYTLGGTYSMSSCRGTAIPKPCTGPYCGVLLETEGHTLYIFGMMLMLKFSLEGRQMTLRSSFQGLWKFRALHSSSSVFSVQASPRVFCRYPSSLEQSLWEHSLGRCMRSWALSSVRETGNLHYEVTSFFQSPSVLQL